MPRTTSPGTAYARRISADLYDVTYQRAADLDASVTDAYLDRLVRRGYRVQIDHGNYRGATTGHDIEIRES